LQDKPVHGKLAELEMSQAKIFLERSLESTPDGVILFDEKGRFSYVNPALLNWMGRREEEFLGKKLTEVSPPALSPEDTKMIAARIQERIHSEVPVTSKELNLIRADGGLIPVSYSAASVRNPSGGVQGEVVFLKNLSEQKKAEEALKKEQDFNTTIVQATPLFFVAIDASGKVLLMNPAMLKTLGYTEEQVKGLDYLSNFVPEANREMLSEVFQQLVQSHKATLNENLVLTKDGRELLVEWHGRPIFDEKGNFDFFLGLGIDITKRKTTEDALRQSEATLSSIFQGAPIGLGLLHNRVFGQVNDQMCEMVGYSSEELIGENVRKLYLNQEEYDRVARDKTKQINESGTGTVETCWQRKDGRIIDVLLSSTPIDPDDRAQGVTFAVLNITQRKQAAERLALTTSFLDTVVDNSPFAMWIADPNGTTVRTNHSLRETLNLTDEQIIGKYNVLADANMDKQGVMALVKGVFEEHEPVRFDMLWQAAEAGDVAFQGARDLYIDVSLFPILNAEGELTQVVCQWVDVTERMQAAAERERLIGDLENRTAELERFIYTVSHDLKSPLITIQEFLGLLQEDITARETEQINTDIQFMTTAANRMQKMLAELLELSRIGRLDNPAEKIFLEDTAREAAELVAGQIHERGVKIDIQPGLPIIYGDRPRLLEVMQNLIENAVKFMGDNHHPKIEVGTRQDDDKTVCFVRDNGIGIESQYHNKIFELFDKLDNNSEGTGIGLALVKRIIETHQGRIWVESEGNGQGSTFCFTVVGKE